MKQKHADSPSAFLAAAMAVTGAAMLLCPLIGQNTEMNRSAAEYDDLRVQLKSEEPAQATDAPAQGKSALRVLLGFPSTTQVPLELPKPDESPPEINVGTGADLAACLAQNDDFIAWIRIPGTNVDYPVVWTDDAEYYLHHTFTGKQGAAGTLFSLMKTDYSIPSRNIAIYGHHLKSSGEKMFTSLMRYKDADFYAGHETVLLDTLYARNKNVLIIGGSGSGKTRFFVKPNLMQCVSDKYPCSFVVTDPKGSILVECGSLLQRSGYAPKTEMEE